MTPVYDLYLIDLGPNKADVLKYVSDRTGLSFITIINKLKDQQIFIDSGIYMRLDLIYRELLSFGATARIVPQSFE